MSFVITTVNLPTKAVYYIPVIYIDSNYYPSYLSVGETAWTCPLAAGAGITVNFRCLTYNSAYGLIEYKDKIVIVKDGASYLYDWAANSFSTLYEELVPVEPEFKDLTVAYRKEV